MQNSSADPAQPNPTSPQRRVGALDVYIEVYSKVGPCNETGRTVALGSFGIWKHYTLCTGFRFPLAWERCGVQVGSSCPNHVHLCAA